MTRLGGGVLERMIGVPVPDSAVFDAAERLLRRLDRVHELLADPDLASVRVVLTLEQISIAEAERSFTYFHLFGYPSDLVVANRVLPEGSGAYFERWRKAQRRYLPMVEQAFAPVPVRTIPWFEREMVGSELLRELGHALFGTGDPTEVLYRGRPYRVMRENGRYVLSLELPFTSREAVSLSRRADELMLQVGGWRRTLVLPHALVGAQAEGARMVDNTLKVYFAAKPRGSDNGGAKR